MIKICDINAATNAKRPPAFGEKSGVGSHYVDALIQPMHTKLAEDTRVACKRSGLKNTLSFGLKRGKS